MDSHKGSFRLLGRTMNEGNCLFGLTSTLNGDNFEPAETSRQFGLRHDPRIPGFVSLLHVSRTL